MLLLDDAEKMSRTHHIGVVAAPRRVQPAGQAKRVVFHFIDTRAGHYPAHLRFFSERQQIGHDIEMFAAPVATGGTHAALHLVKNEKDIVFVANLSQPLQPFTTEMIVTALTLDRLDDNGADVDAVLIDEIAD